MAVRTIRKGVRAVKRYYGLGRYKKTQPKMGLRGTYFSTRGPRTYPVLKGKSGSRVRPRRIAKAQMVAHDLRRAHKLRRRTTVAGAGIGVTGIGGYAIYHRKKKKR